MIGEHLDKSGCLDIDGHFDIGGHLDRGACLDMSVCLDRGDCLNGVRVSKGVKIRNRYNQVPHLTQDTNGKVTNSQLDTTNESQEVSPFPAGDHKAHINGPAQRLIKHKTEKT